MTPCRLCNGENARPFHEESGFRYVQCGACGFVYLHPRPTDRALHELYQAESGATFHHGAETGEGYEKRLEARMRFRLIRESLGGVERRALEVGCGAGYFLEHLRRAGWATMGCEAAEVYVRFARERLDLDVRRDFAECPGPFGAAFLFNVLSHLSEPERDLRAIRERLADGGVVVLETGNAPEVSPCRVGVLGAPDHLHLYSESNLRTLLARCGFRNVRILRFNVEWQRRLLSLNPRRGGGGGGGATVRRASWRRFAKSLLSHVLLGLRYDAGRWLADRRHFCTLIAVARR